MLPPIPALHGTKPPRIVVFEFKDTMRSYEGYVERMCQAEIDLEALFNDVLNAVRFKYTADGELVNLASAFVAGNQFWLGDETELLEQAIFALGNGVYQKLESNGFYDKDGIHHYQLHGLTMQNSLVLELSDQSQFVAF